MKSSKFSLNAVLPETQAPAHLARNLIETTLRDAILDGRLVSGTPLRQEELASLFGVSRMPVREALRQLEAQALIQIVPHKGAVVTQLSGDDAVETYALRLLLEPEVLRQSIPHLQAEDFAEARAHISAMETETDLASLGRLNRLFHLSLYRRAQNRKLLRLVDNELQEEERFLRFHLSALGLEEMAQDDHLALVALAEAGDCPGAMAVLGRHLHQASTTIKHYLDKRMTS